MNPLDSMLEGSDKTPPEFGETGDVPDETGGGETLPDWLRAFRGDMPEELDAKETLPEWMTGENVSSAPGEPQNSMTPPRQEPTEAKPADQPSMDWGHLEQPPSQELIPDWLDSLRSGSADTKISQEQPNEAGLPASPDEELPIWLASFEKPSLDEPELVPFTPPPFESKPAALEPEEETSQPFAQENGLPAWLANLQDIPPEERDSESTMPPSTMPEPARTKPIEDEPFEEEMPDWLVDLGGVETQIKPAPAVPEEMPQAASLLPAAKSVDRRPGAVSDEIYSEESLHSLLGSQKEDTAALDYLKGAVAPFLPGEELGTADNYPNWFTELSAQEPNEPESAETSEAVPSLEEGKLPTWLEAIRPMEAALPGVPTHDESDKRIEGAGPLAGLRGILPSEPDVTGQKKSPTYSVKLQVSEKQQAYTTLLEQMIQQEGTPRPVGVSMLYHSQRLLRILIFVILLISIGWSLFTGVRTGDLPQFPQEVFAARTLIEDLPGGAPVLLAVDYQPGFSGEIESAASALVDHLMIKGAYLTLVSTVPTGPPQAEWLITDVNRRSSHQYQNESNYMNLGFLPGGLAGLRAFAEAPRQVLPYTVDDRPAWEGTPLKNIRRLSDYALVIVLTESPETGRAWIEQVQPVLGGRPLLMVVSAQAEPLVRPYFDGNPQQVQGMIVGLAGGASYEKMLNRAGIAAGYWGAFSLGSLVIALLILLGCVISIGRYVVGNKKAKQREGKP